MIRVELDDDLRERLGNLSQRVELFDASGTVVGYVQPLGHRTVSADGPVKSPFSDEEIRQRAQNRSGRSLNEILADLQRQ